MNKANKKKKEAIFNPDDEDIDFERGRKIVCSCNEDPNYCEVHNVFGSK